MNWKNISLTLIAIGFHLPFISSPPNGFHKWREVDTATVAENFTSESMNPFYPSVNAVSSTGVRTVGTELPVYTYTVALLYNAFGFSHIWPRILSLIFFVLFALSMREYFSLRHEKEFAYFFALFSPLVFFYGFKIQPDILALCCVSWGFVHYRRWLDNKSFFLVPAVLIGIAGGIKPTYLFVGLPMLFFTPRKKIFQALKVAIPIVTLVGLWFYHARTVDKLYGDSYFYLGGNVYESMQFIFTWNFYQNTFLTWPMELAVAPFLLPFVLFGIKNTPEKWPYFWILGCYSVFVLSAGHCATPHDYYYLPMVVPLIFLLVKGFVIHKRYAWIILMFTMTYTPFRLQNRVSLENDFWQARSLGINEIDVVDRIPGRVFYWLGAKGKRISVSQIDSTRPVAVDSQIPLDENFNAEDHGSIRIIR